jgi:hypothetical protein
MDQQPQAQQLPPPTYAELFSSRSFIRYLVGVSLLVTTQPLKLWTSILARRPSGVRALAWTDLGA